MSARTSICGLVGFPADLLQSFATEEVARSLGITLVSCDCNELPATEMFIDFFAFYVTDDTYNTTLEALREFKTTRDSDIPVHFVLVAQVSFSQDLNEAWQLGMYSYVPIAEQVDNLYFALNSFARYRREFTAMQHQLKEASDIAVLSMSDGSQLGEIIRFMEKSYQCQEYVQLGALLERTISMMGLSNCGVIRNPEGALYFGDPEKRTFMERLIKQQQNQGQFVDVGNRTTVNFEHVSVMVRNLPEPGTEPHGRMKDVLCALVAGANARIKAIANTRAKAAMNRTKLNFLSVMSHELRTPMNSILGFSGRLKTKKLGDALTERDMAALTFLQDNAQRLLGMIDNVFELTRIDADAGRACKRLLVSDVIMGVVKKYEALALSKGLQYEVSGLEGGMNAELDPRRLQQIVTQLLDNAVKYTEKGKISVDLRSLHRQGVGAVLQFSVSDSGVGISEAYQQELFKPFGQVDEYLSRGSDGVRLGLALVSKFVTDQNGEIEVQSTEGEGTSFVVRLPQFLSVMGDSRDTLT